MVKNFSDCGFLQEGGDDFHIPATMRAALNVDLKHPLEQTCPTDAHGSRGRRHIVIRIGCITFVFLAARNNLSAQFGVRRKHPMETNKVEPWPGNQRSQPLHEFQWRHDDVGRAIPIRCLQL